MNRFRYLFLNLSILLVVALSSSSVLAQKVLVNKTHIDSLSKIQAEHSTDSLFQAIGRLPIWLIDQNTALEITGDLEISTDQYGPERKYLFDISKHVESDLILDKLNEVIDYDLENIRDSLTNDGSVVRFRKDLPIAYYYQDQDEVIHSLSSRVEKLQELLELAEGIAEDEKRDIITRLFVTGSSIYNHNVNILTSNIHALVSILNRINPEQFTDDQIKALESSISKRYRNVLQEIDLPSRSAKLRTFHSASVSKRSEHYLFNDDANALDPRLDNLVMNVNVIYRNEHKKLVQEYTTYADAVDYYSPSYLTTYLIYTSEDEVIELMIEDITYN